MRILVNTCVLKQIWLCHELVSNVQASVVLSLIVWMGGCNFIEREPEIDDFRALH